MALARRYESGLALPAFGELVDQCVLMHYWGGFLRRQSLRVYPSQQVDKAEDVGVAHALSPCEEFLPQPLNRARFQSSGVERAPIGQDLVHCADVIRYEASDSRGRRSPSSAGEGLLRATRPAARLPAATSSSDGVP